MTEYEINEARKRYSALLLQKNQLTYLEEELQKIEGDPTLKKYLLLKEQIRKFKDIDYSINKIFYNIAKNTNCSNKILVYMGSYCINHLGCLQLCDFKQGDFIRYDDLETLKSYKIDINKRLEFESSNNVVYVKEENPEFGNNPYSKGFWKLRENFFYNLIKKPQEEVVNQIVKGKK